MYEFTDGENDAIGDSFSRFLYVVIGFVSRYNKRETIGISGDEGSCQVMETLPFESSVAFKDETIGRSAKRFMLADTIKKIEIIVFVCCFNFINNIV